MPHCEGWEGAKRRCKWRAWTLDVTPVSLQTVKELLESLTQTINDISYFNCLNSLIVSPELGAEVWGRM